MQDVCRFQARATLGLPGVSFSKARRFAYKLCADDFAILGQQC